MKSKATLVIISEEIYQNYFLSGLINIFLEKFELSIICEDSIYHKIKPFSDENNIRCLSYTKNRFLMTIFLGLSLRETKRMAKLCRGFNLRLERMHSSLKYFQSFGCYQFLKTTIKDYLYLLISFYLAKKDFKRLIGRLKQSSLIKSLSVLNPKYTFIPCQAVSYEIFYVSLAIKKMIIKTLDICLVDNWDNLCSKSTFLVKPYKVGVYSQQAKNHADRIQGLNNNSVFIWGSPRYDLYLKSAEKTTSKTTTKPYILYAGTSIYYDEISDLERYYSEINKTELKKYMVKYLPHPFRTIPKKFRRKISLHTFDKNIQLIDRLGFRNLNQVVDLVKKANFIICGPTSIILEAILCNKKLLISSRSDLESYQSNSEIFFGYDHFNGLELNPLIKIVTEKSSLNEILRWAEKEPSIEEKIKSKEHLNYYLKTDLDRRYILSRQFP